MISREDGNSHLLMYKEVRCFHGNLGEWGVIGFHMC